MTTHAQRDEISVRSAPRESAESDPSVALGIGSGVLGAFVVALFFFAIDLLHGRPLWTPSALGSALFLGERLPADAAPQPAVVAGYTFLHGLVFVAWGRFAAFLLGQVRKPPRSELAVVGILAAALFALFEITFTAMTMLFESQLLGDLGSGAVAAANFLAAAAMAVYLARRSRRHAEAEADA